MDIKEIRQKTEKELQALVAELREKLRGLRFEASAEAVKNVREIREMKKTVARALTEIKARPKNAAPAAAKTAN